MSEVTLFDLDEASKSILRKILIVKEGEDLEKLVDLRSTRDDDMYFKGRIAVLREIDRELSKAKE